MADEPRFDRAAILRTSAIIIGGAALFGFLVPLAGVFIAPWNTRNVSGSEIYRWAYWAIAWALTIWQASWMIREVHERIIDDMIVTAIIVAVVLVIVKFVIWIVYDPRINWDPVTLGDRLGPITAIDAGGALMLIVVALIGARINRY